MIPIGSAYSAGTLTLRSGSVIVAEELLSEGAGFAVSKAGEAMDLNPTATMLLSIAASMGTSAGLGKLDQAYNVSGSFPKIDVTAQNPASMIGDIDGVPTSTGIDVPGAKVDDAIEGIGKVEGASKTGKFNNWDDMKETYKGTVTKFITENKPKNSPDIKKWFDKGGSIEIESIDGKQIWTYTSSAGDTVPYVDGYVKFPDEYLNPTIKSVDIGEFTGDRSKDIKKMLEVLEEDYGITEIPDGYIVHHDIENGILQLVDENIHKEFTHIGGHSIYQ